MKFRRCGSISSGAWVLAFAVGFEAPGQILDLTPPRPLPAISELGLVEALSPDLETAIRRLDLARRAAGANQAPAVQAMRGVRALSLANLRSIDAEAAAGSAAAWLALAGALRLLDGLPTLDAAIRAALTGRGEEGQRRLVAVATAFDAPDADRSSEDRRRLAALLLEALDPLALPESCWPRLDVRDGAAAGPLPPTLADLRARLEVAGRSPVVSAALGNLLTTLEERSAVDPEHAPRPAPFADARLRLAAGQILDLAEALERTSLLDRLRREAFEAHLAAIAERLGAPGVGDAAGDVSLLAALEASATAQVLRLAEAARPGLGDASRALSTLTQVLLRMDTQVAPDATPRPWRSKRAVAQVLSEIALGRASDAAIRSPSLVEARKSLQLELRKTQQSLVDSLGTLLEAPSLRADPAMATLVRSHQRLVEDLRWLERLPEVVRVLAASAASRGGAGGGTDGSDTPAAVNSRELERSLLERLTSLARDLSNHARRPDALQARAQLERQMQAFLELPGEGPGTAAVQSLLGPERWSQVQRSIGRSRQEWVAAWADGDTGGPAARRLLGLLRTLRCAEAVAVMKDAATFDRTMAALERWCGWSIPSDAMRFLVDATSLEAGDDAAAKDATSEERRLRALEQATALPRLALRLAERLAPAVGNSTSPAAGVLAPFIADPPEDAWGLEYLAPLSRIAVLAKALLAADGDPQRARSLREALDAEANALLQQMGEWRGPIPTVRF